MSLFSFFLGRKEVPQEETTSTDSVSEIILFPELFNPEKVTIERLDLKAYYPHRQRECTSTSQQEASSSSTGTSSYAPYALVLHNILSKEECEALIRKSEAQKFEVAQVNVGNGNQKLLKDIRNNDRTFLDDVYLAQNIWNRIASVLTIESEPQLHSILTNDGDTKWTAVGLNERLRVLRYDPGTYFAPHFDGCYTRNDITHPQYGDTSFMTIQIYLNEGFQGGATAFLDPTSVDDEAKINVIPKTGSILVFEHKLLHEGSILEKGRKYTIRSDIMYHKA